MRTAALKLGRLVFVLFIVTFLSFWMLKLQERKGDLVVDPGAVRGAGGEGPAARGASA